MLSLALSSDPQAGAPPVGGRTPGHPRARRPSPSSPSATPVSLAPGESVASAQSPLPADVAAAPPTGTVLINKRELGKLLGVSLPTVSALIDRYPDLPISRRGTNGVEWQIDGNAVVAFLRDKREEEARTRSVRDELLAQLTLPLDLDDAPAPGGTVISVKDQLDAAKLRDVLRKEREAAGKLVDAATVETEFASILANLNRELHGFLRRIGRDMGWPDEVTARYEADLSALQNRLVDDADDLFSDAEPQHVRRAALG